MEALNAPVEHTLRLPIEVIFRHTTAMGKLWQAMKRLVKKPAPQHRKSLLDIAVSNSRVLSTLVCTAKNNTTHQQGQSATEITHSLLSGILSAVYWSVCAHCRHGQPSILPSLQPHVSNSKTNFTAVLGTGLTGLAQCSGASLQCYFGSLCNIHSSFAQRMSNFANW